MNEKMKPSERYDKAEYKFWKSFNKKNPLFLSTYGDVCGIAVLNAFKAGWKQSDKSNE